MSRIPALHFLLIGSLLFLVNAWMAGRGFDAEGELIVITSAQMDRERQDWIQLHKKAPAPADERAILQELTDNEILLREAYRIRLDKTSPVVQRRLLQIAGFVDLDPEASVDAKLSEARKLGLDRDDPIIRRHLIGMMQGLYKTAGPRDRPNREEVEAYVKENAHRFVVSERVGFDHVYLSADRRGNELADHATALLTRLRAEALSPEQAIPLGDPFLRGHHVPAQHLPRLARVFGAKFVEGLKALPVGVWSGPVESAYGLHLVWIRERLPETMPAFETISRRAYHELVESRGAERLHERMEELREEYSVRVEREGDAS